MQAAPAALESQPHSTHPATLGPSAGPSLRDLPLTLAFIALFLVQLVHHNLWRDELNAFGIAAASPSLATLFHYIHYEGHPWLWYFLLWIVTKFTLLPWGMKVLQALIGTGIYLMLGLASPFSRWEKVLLFLGFFITFEYTVMVRMYGVMLLLALVYIRQRVLHPERALGLALLLGLIASTDALGVILSLALLAEYAYARLRGANQPAIPARRLAAAGLVYLALLGLSVYSAKTAPDISWRTTHHIFAHAKEPAYLLEAAQNYIALPYLLGIRRPLRDFWVGPSPHPVFFTLCIPLVLLAYWSIFRRHRGLLLLVGTTILGGILFGHLIYHGAQRQFGITFLGFLLALWVLRAGSPRLPAAACLLLGLSAIGGLVANAGQWAAPFSNAEPTVAWLQANGLAQGPIAGTPDTTLSDIAELLHRPVYALDCNCSDTFLLFSNRRDGFSEDQVPARLALAAQNLHAASFLFLDARPLTPQETAAIAAQGLTLTPLTRFTGAEADAENFFVYRVIAPRTPPSVRP
jgi:hypothetical protein